MKTDQNTKVILIGGASHVGKSTVAERMGTEMGWSVISTDSLARHPGRPWRPQPDVVPDHVAEHYLSLSVDELLSDVLRHYRVNVWPKVEEIVVSYSNDAPGAGVIVEGSALWPEFAIGLHSDGVAALWLTASRDVLTQRIYGESLYHSKTVRGKMMIDKFLERTLAYDALMVEVAGRHGLALVDVLQSSPEELTGRCLSVLSVDRLQS